MNYTGLAGFVATSIAKIAIAKIVTINEADFQPPKDLNGDGDTADSFPDSLIVYARQAPPTVNDVSMP